MTDLGPGSDVEGDVRARLAQVEKAIEILADTSKNFLNSAVQSVKRLDHFEMTSGAARVREGLAQASLIYPKKKSVIFVGRECGGDTRFEYFGDNIKYAFLSFAAAAQRRGVACHFLTDQQKLFEQITQAGLPCLPWSPANWGPEHVEVLLAAKLKVLCNVFYPVNERGFFMHALLQGAKSVQLWHGIPFKRIGLENILPLQSYHPRAAEVLGASGVWDLFCGSSRSQRAEWEHRFVFNDYAPIGAPRTDLFFRTPTAQDLINVDLTALRRMEEGGRQGRPFILYAPTFREGELGAWLDKAKVASLSSACRSMGVQLAINLHPFEAGWVGSYRERFGDILFVEPLTDVQPILQQSAALITDYSSIAFDYLLIDRPILFYRPDHVSYVAHSRALIADHASYLCGPVAATHEELSRFISESLENVKAGRPDGFAPARDAVRQRLYDEVTGGACERLNEALFSQLDDPS